MLVPGDEPIPGYRLEKFLGQGQFGQVWKSTSPGGTSAALKILDLGGKQGWKEFEAIQHVKRLVHPHLMPITSLWLVDDTGAVISDDLLDTLSMSRSGVAETIRPDSTLDKVTPRWLIVANLLGDKSLQDVLSEYQDKGEQGVPVAELLAYMTEAAKGIDYLNSSVHLGDQKASVQHCDIKPANMLLVGGSVMICDFGVSKILNDGISATATGMIGSMAYMSPECVDRKPSTASDQYSLAVSYYQLRTGRLPFVDESVATVLASHQSGKLDFSSVGPAEAAVLRKATSPLPQNRYSTAQEMVDALRQALAPVTGQKKASPLRLILPVLATAGIVAGIFYALNNRSSPPTPDSPPKYVVEFSGLPSQVRIDGKEVAVGPDGHLEVTDVTKSEFLVEVFESEQYEPLRQTLNTSEFTSGPVQIALQQKPAFLVSRARDLLTNGDFANAVIQYAEAIRLAPDQYARAPAPVLLPSPNSQRLTTIGRSNFADLIAGDEAGTVFLWQWSDSPRDAMAKELHSNQDAIDSLAVGNDRVASVGLSGRIVVSSQKQSSTTPLELQV
ncbi:MAG: serine/threonine protein kinase, partial [Planctomycetales bacterium]|nr:serine/threonine protein kinase [Planctomycetales bacterium]